MWFVQQPTPETVEEVAGESNNVPSLVSCGKKLVGYLIDSYLVHFGILVCYSYGAKKYVGCEM